MTFPNRLLNGLPPDFETVQANLDYLLALGTRNPLQNPGFESWGNGTSFTNPASAAVTVDGWSYEKAGTAAPTANVAREATTIDSEVYSLKYQITGAGSSNSYGRIKQSIANYGRYAGRTVMFGARVFASNASKVRLKAYDGTTTTPSGDHSGGGAWETLYVVVSLGTAITELTVYLDVTGDFTGSVFIDSAFVVAIDPSTSAVAKDAIAYDPLLLRNPALTDWTAFTPTGGWNTNVTYTGKWRRVGDSIEIQFKIACTGAPNNVAPTLIIPSGLTIDTAKILGTTADESPVDGRCVIVDSGTAIYTGRVLYSSTTAVRFRFEDDAAAAVQLVTMGSNTAPFTFGNADYIQGIVKLPITGWAA